MGHEPPYPEAQILSLTPKHHQIIHFSLTGTIPQIHILNDR